MKKISVINSGLLLNYNNLTLCDLNSIRGGLEFCINFSSDSNSPINDHCGFLVGGSDTCINKTVCNGKV